MAKPTFVAGHFSISVDGVNYGHTEVGFNIVPIIYREDIKIDAMGDVIVDGIYRGYQVSLNFELSEASDAAISAFRFWYDTVPGTIVDVGTLLSDAAATIVFTPVAGINANNKTWTFPLCVPQGNHGGFTLANKLQKTKGDFLVLPDLNTLPGRLFTKT